MWRNGPRGPEDALQRLRREGAEAGLEGAGEVRARGDHGGAAGRGRRRENRRGGFVLLGGGEERAGRRAFLGRERGQLPLTCRQALLQPLPGAATAE